MVLRLLIEVVTLNLRDEKCLPYRKPKNDRDRVHIDSRSNHPPAIIQSLPKSINRRISTLSSSESTFHSVANTYETALKNSNYKTKLEYGVDSFITTPDNRTTLKKRKRKRHIIWFNPLFTKNKRSNIGRGTSKRFLISLFQYKMNYIRSSTVIPLKLAIVVWTK